MVRQFKVIRNTAFKATGTKRVSDMKDDEYISLLAGDVLIVNGDIEEAGNKHFKINLQGYIFKEYIKEIKVAGNDIVPYETGVRLFGRRYTQPVHNDLQKCLKLFNINTTARVRHFLAQCGHESGGLKWRVELASGRAYEGRRDLGNTKQGWGVLYKGGGFLQLTGRTNYLKLYNWTQDGRVLSDGATYVGNVYPWTSAGVWWQANRMNRLIDNGAGVRQVSLRVNGGTNGLQDRYRWYNLTSIVKVSV